MRRPGAWEDPDRSSGDSAFIGPRTWLRVSRPLSRTWLSIDAPDTRAAETSWSQLLINEFARTFSGPLTMPGAQEAAVERLSPSTHARDRGRYCNTTHAEGMALGTERCQERK